jgi:HEAT repeat protein
MDFSGMFKRQFYSLVFVLFVGLCVHARAAEPVKDDGVDEDVLRKVRKLIDGTLSTEEADREKAWKGLQDMGNLAVPGLLGVYRLKTTTPKQMGSILIALEDSKDPRSGAALVELMGSSEATIRRDAARAIGKSGYKAGREAVAKVASDAKEDEEVRLFAATALAKLGSEDGFKVLVELLKSPNPEIRSRAVFNIGDNGGAKFVADVDRALDDSDASVREDAVEALRHIKKRDAWNGLIKATADSDYKVRGAALDALREVTGEKFEGAQAWQEWWKKQNEKKDEKSDKKEKKDEKAENEDAKK